MMDIFNRISSDKLTPNEFFFMYCMRESISPANINTKQILEGLIEKQWIKDLTNAEGYKYKLEPKADILLDDVYALYLKPKKKTNKFVSDDTFLKNVSIYNELFPRKKAGSGKYMRSNIKSVEDNFKWFLTTYKYSWEVILKATKAYMLDQELKDYKFARTSMYFIRKMENKQTISDLADWCEMISSGADEGRTHSFSEKVV